jgi:hypothetical protein
MNRFLADQTGRGEASESLTVGTGLRVENSMVMTRELRMHGPAWRA